MHTSLLTSRRPVCDILSRAEHRAPSFFLRLTWPSLSLLTPLSCLHPDYSELGAETRTVDQGTQGHDPSHASDDLPTNESSSPQHRLSADVAGEVSYLSINASGERNYLGSSSGVLLANFIRANVNIETSTRSMTPLGDDEATDSTALAAELARDLPSEQIARRLVLSYLNHDHLRYPVVLPATLLSILSETYSTNGALYTRTTSEAFIFDIVLAIATASICRSDWQGLPSAHSHYTRAMKRGSTILEKGGLAALQAIILLIQYRMSSSMQDTSASMLPYLRQTEESFRCKHDLKTIQACGIWWE
ncbi:Zn2Cys6 [Alternaria alternata]|nr:Zn2Cys6 [Alternaria alternata]